MEKKITQITPLKDMFCFLRQRPYNLLRPLRIKFVLRGYRIIASLQFDFVFQNYTIVTPAIASSISVAPGLSKIL